MTNQGRKKKNSHIKFLASWILFFTITAGVLYIISIVFGIYLSDNIKFIELSDELKKISISTIYFLKPFITITIFVFLVEWIFVKLGIDLTDKVSVFIKKCNAKKL